MYQDLLEMERKLDWTMMRKRVEVQDALGRTPNVRFLCKINFYISTFILHTECLLHVTIDNTHIEDILGSYSIWSTLAKSGRDTACGKFRNWRGNSCLGAQN